MRLFAHDGEIDSTVSGASFFDTWYIWLALFLATTALVAAAAYRFSKHSLPVTLLATSAAVLVASIASYSAFPLMSALGLSIGLSATLLSVLAMLAQPPTKGKRS